jgi:hypothetical protein
MNARLDAVSKAKQAYVLARTTLEQRLREILAQELANLATQVDLAVRYAHDAGESKASIMRSLGTKDYHTLNASLERTLLVSEIVGDDPLDKVYDFDTEAGTLSVTYANHGPSAITGIAFFDVKKMDDGSTWFMSRNSLWNEDYTVRNEVVAALDGRQDGYYYDEAVRYVNGRQL